MTLPNGTSNDSSKTGDEEPVLIRVNPRTGQSSINKSAYARLHRNSLGTNRYSVEGIRGRFEQLSSPSPTEPFSPTTFGYSKNAKLRFPEIREKKSDENSNHVVERSEQEIIRQAPSIDSLDQISKDLDDFTMMDGKSKEKKRGGSIRRIFGIFNKDKQSQKKKKDDEKKTIIYDNMTNETSFNRQAPQRHTLPNQRVTSQREEQAVENKYAEKHVQRFNEIRQSFASPGKPAEIQRKANGVEEEPARTIDRNLNKPEEKDYQLHKPHFDETYGTVFDNVDSRRRQGEEKPSNSQQRPLPTLPRTLEGTKLRIPPNREIYDVQPKVKSPIPVSRVSTDKIIATELLKKKEDRDRDRDRPVVVVGRKPPISPKSPVLKKLQLEVHKTSAVVHTPRSQTPVSFDYGNPGDRPMSPSELRMSAALKLSPQKDDVKKQVEEYYWKQLKKMKEEEDRMYNIEVANAYYEQQQQARVRRSRSLSPTTHHQTRRSISLPRENQAYSESTYGRVGGHQSIPEHQTLILSGTVPRPVVYENNYNYNYNYRNVGAERRNYEPVSYQNRPIFRRGSLTKQEIYESNPYNKRVSFSSSNSSPVWPTKNGFTQSPPQRRESYLEDEVFLPEQEPIYGRHPQQVQYRPASQVIGPRRMSVDSLAARPPQEYYVQRPLPTPPSSYEYNYVRQHQQQQFPTGSQLSLQQLQRNPVYSSRQSVAESVYGQAKQVTVHNKYADIYGQIHEKNGGGRQSQSGVIVGKLQLQQHQHPQQGFVRGTRLTQSASNISRNQQLMQHQHQQRVYQNEQGAARGVLVNNYDVKPLPPAPVKNGRFGSDTDSYWSDASEQVKLKKTKTKKKGFFDEEWNADGGKSGRSTSGNDSGRSDNEGGGGEVRGRSRNARRDDPRRHTLGADQQYLAMAGQGGPLSRTMDLEGQPRGYPPPSNAMLFDDDPGIMSEVETSSTGFRRGGKQRSSLPVVRTPSKTLERPLGLVFLQYRNETKRALLPNEITSIDTVKALFVRSFPKQLTMEYLDSPNVKIYIHDSSKDMFYELEDLRSHLREIRDRSVLRLFESADVSGGLPMAGIGIAGGVGHFEDPSYFSEPEFDSEYQHQHIHKSKASTGKAAPYYMGSTASLPRGATLLRTYSPAVGALPADRLKALPTGAPPKPQRAYSSSGGRVSDGPPRPPDRFVPFQRPANPFHVPDGYMSSPERSSRYEDPYYSQYASRSGSITPVIDEEISDTELLDDSYSLYGVKLPPGGPRGGPRSPFPPPVAGVPYDPTRLRVENMERQLANLTGLVQKALTQTPTSAHLQVPGRENYRAAGDEFDKNSSSSSASLPDDSYLRSDSKTPKLGKSGCHKSVSFEKSVSFSDEPPDMNSPKQHSPQHSADTKPAKPAIKSSTLPRTSSQERDRLKPAPPPKPASLSPGQYDNRMLYRDLQLTPEMYNQLRGLQKKAKDLRAEVRNLRRMSQAQAHSVRETIRDTFIKIRAMLLAGGEQVWQAGMDQERVRLSREEDLYKQEMLRLETDLSDLESTVEELRGNVINRKTRVNMSDVENMALVLSKSSKTVADLKLRFPNLQDGMKTFLGSEMEKVMREEKFLKEEPERLESALRRCKKLTGTLVTLKRLASVQEQRLPCSNSSGDGRLSPTSTETPPITPTSSQHSKPVAAPRVGSLLIGGDSLCSSPDGNQRPENALDALLDELQTFSKPHTATVTTQLPQDSEPPPAIPAKGIAPHPPHMSEIGRKGSMDSATFLPAQNLTVSTATGSLRRLHSYPSGSDTDNSPPIQPLKPSGKPPIPERNAELLQHVGRRIPPPPPPRTSSKSPLASPTSPGLPPRSTAAGLQHIQNVQTIVENNSKPQSQFEAATQNLGLVGTLRRNTPNRSSLKSSSSDCNNKAQTLPRNIGSNLQVAVAQENDLAASNSSSCESVNSQDGSKKNRKEELEHRHQELLKKQKALQEQYARLQQLQRGNNTLAVVPPTSELLKKTGSESNLLQKMGLQMATSQITGSLTNLPNTANNAKITTLSNAAEEQTTMNTTTNKVYETDIL